jgi:hypothetical protein
MDRAFVLRAFPEIEQKHAGRFVVVEGGTVVALGTSAAAAAAAADLGILMLPAKPLPAGTKPPDAKPRPPAEHRFVFRPEDAGDRLYRAAFVPSGGLVAGRRLLEDLGFRVVKTDGEGRVTLERGGKRTVFDPRKTPRVALALTSLNGRSARTLEVPLDADFDGGLFLPPALAIALDAPLAEIPGTCEVQFAVGRPTAVLRGWARARSPDLDAEGTVEILWADPAALRTGSR